MSHYFHTAIEISPVGSWAIVRSLTAAISRRYSTTENLVAITGFHIFFDQRMNYKLRRDSNYERNYKNWLVISYCLDDSYANINLISYESSRIFILGADVSFLEKIFVGFVLYTFFKIEKLTVSKLFNNTFFGIASVDRCNNVIQKYYVNRHQD